MQISQHKQEDFKPKTASVREVAGLSNTSFTDLVQCLTEQHQDQVRRPQRERAGWPDGRREFGTVSKAVLAVLTAAGSEMRVKAIHAEVERMLGGPVSRYSVSDYLRTQATGRRPLFVRTRHGHYQLVTPPDGG